MFGCFIVSVAALVVSALGVVGYLFGVILRALVCGAYIWFAGLMVLLLCFDVLWGLFVLFLVAYFVWLIYLLCWLWF